MYRNRETNLTKRRGIEVSIFTFQWSAASLCVSVTSATVIRSALRTSPLRDRLVDQKPYCDRMKDVTCLVEHLWYHQPAESWHSSPDIREIVTSKNASKSVCGQNVRNGNSQNVCYLESSHIEVSTPDYTWYYLCRTTRSRKSFISKYIKISLTSMPFAAIGEYS